MDTKTNAMRILEKMKISFEIRTYECDEFIDGMQTSEVFLMVIITQLVDCI